MYSNISMRPKDSQFLESANIRDLITYIFVSVMEQAMLA